jgi:hypothetical protein
MARVAAERPDAHLTVLGGAERPGDMRKFLRGVRKKGLTANVTAVGYRRDVWEYYARASVYVMTSAVEGFPTTLIESKFHGIPCVAYELPYIEMMRDREGMLTVAYGDRIGMAESILRLLGDDALRKETGRAARRGAEKYARADHAAVWRSVIAGVTETDRAKRAQAFAFAHDRETGRILMDTVSMYSGMGASALKAKIQIVRPAGRRIRRAVKRLGGALPLRARRFLLQAYRFCKRLLRRT